MPPARKKAAKKPAAKKAQTASQKPSDAPQDSPPLEDQEAQDPQVAEKDPRERKPDQPRHRPLAASRADHAAAHDARQAALAAGRAAPNTRTGDPSIPMGPHRPGGASDWVSQDRPN